MKEIDSTEVKQIELGILRNIDEFCKKNKLQYFLAYGTLIGAIRHNGFIPWDDDIDIQMPRDDYNRMIKLYNQDGSINGQYRLISPYDRGAKHSFAKVIDVRTVKIEAGIKYNSDYLGVDVDIFPIDGMPDSDDQYDIWYDKLKKIYKKFNYCIASTDFGSLKYRMFVCAMKVIYHDKNKYLKKAEKIHSQYKLCENEYAGTMESYFNIKRNRTRRKYFDNSIGWEFEGNVFSVPEGYDGILKDIYGDYMKLPSKEEQITHHVNNVFWAD